jgi:hypothetical protein
MSDTNERVKRLEHIMNEGLSKLDLLETMVKNLDTFELNISQMRIEIDDIKETQDKHIRIIDKQETHHHNVEGRLRNLENSRSNFDNPSFIICSKRFTRSLVSDMLEYIICGVTVFIEFIGSDIIWLGFCTNGI